ncbi:hypothetical protein QWZ08_10630 [Ferruginibacter paludis]|uniref:hypothetical protein n=1 Tax=Ferruginibacter paludis TaxID=1310417 RepID=UPI0025B2A03E|nr:hypothetical protein [Ferruginibacter paludis]MDN3656083.1 hypothetical protein [Ferruginibacter paludis]
MSIYENLIEGLGDLKQRRFTVDFKLDIDAINCNDAGIILYPSNFEIVENYRFEADTNPDDSSVLYSIN